MISLSDFQTGIGVAVSATEDTEQPISDNIVTLENNLNYSMEHLKLTEKFSLGWEFT